MPDERRGARAARADAAPRLATRGARPARTDDSCCSRIRTARRWDHDAIDEGLALLDDAIALGVPGPYQLQAAIAACTLARRDAEDTDWPQIAALYGRLMPWRRARSSRSTAPSRSRWPTGRGGALPLVDALAGELDGYHLLHATRADLLRRLGDDAGARDAYRRAAERTSNASERAYLERRIGELIRDP